MAENFNITSSRVKFFKLENIKGEPLPFAFRPGTSDEYVVNAIFKTQEYLLQLKNFQPKLILDCGGNIGCSAVYFAVKYPSAKIYCVEPQKDNFTLLKMNTKFYANVFPCQFGIMGQRDFYYS